MHTEVKKRGVKGKFAVATLIVFAALISPHLPSFAAPYSNPIGLQRVILIPVQFADTPAAVQPSALASVVALLDRYYFEVSYGRVNVSGEIIPLSITLSQPLRYYGADEAKPGDDAGGNENGSLQLVIDAVKAADPHVDYSRYDFVMIVHAGADQAEASPFDLSDDIWSQTLWDFPRISTTDKASVTRASILSEKSPFGAFAHEFAHLIGSLPDLYDESDRRNHFVGPWSLMDSGSSLGSPPGSQPSQLEAWSRIQLGWLTPAVSLGEGGDFLVSPLEEATGTRAVQIPVGRSTYYLVEVRRRVGFDASLPGEGVLVYFVDESRGSGEGIVRVVNPGGFNLDRVAMGVGSVFRDGANQVFVKVVKQEGSSFRIQVSAQLEFVLMIEVKTVLSVFESATATIKLEPPVPGLLLDVYLDGELYRSYSTLTEGNYEVFLLFDFAKIGEHTLRAVLLDKSGMNRISSEARFQVIMPTYVWMLLFAVGIVAALVGYQHFRTRGAQASLLSPSGHSQPGRTTRGLAALCLSLQDGLVQIATASCM